MHVRGSRALFPGPFMVRFREAVLGPSFTAGRPMHRLRPPPSPFRRNAAEWGGGRARGWLFGFTSTRRKRQA